MELAGEAPNFESKFKPHAKWTDLWRKPGIEVSLLQSTESEHVSQHLSWISKSRAKGEGPCPEHA